MNDMKAGIDACIKKWLDMPEIAKAAETVATLVGSQGNGDEQSFLLWSCDLSGIQSFIYSISGADALKQLRARSFCLELLLEHCVDELLSRLGLTRNNLLYTGGGHAYVLLPNTQDARRLC